MRFANLTQAVFANARAHAGAPSLRFFRGGGWREISWAELGRRVERIAGGVAALGVEAGEHVAIVSANRPEWALADLGAIAAGCPVVSVFPTLPADEMAYILAHGKARLAFVEDAAQAERVRAVQHRLPRLSHLVCLDGEAGTSGALPLATFEDLATAEVAERALRRGLDTQPDAPIAVIYTSGTTGVPKGVVLTHRNLLGTLDAVLEAFGDTSALTLNLSFLPLAHALERVAGHFLPLYLGRTIAYARSLETVAEDLRTVRPRYAVAVPRVFEKVYARVQAEVARSSPFARALFHWCVAVGMLRSQLVERGSPIPLSLAARFALADLLVLRRVRVRMGGRLRLLVSGGAPLSASIARFFHACGLLICEGWGATETSAPSTWNTPSAYRLGSVGRPLPGVEVRTAADGELEVRGVNVFAGYLDDPEATAEAFTADGFYRTGDIGRSDDDGFFYITDRKKELIITAGGKNIAPQKIENLLRARPFVSNCMVHGDRRPFVVALVTPDRMALAADDPTLAAAPVEGDAVSERIAAQVAEVNRHLARYEQIRKFRVVEPDFSPEGGELSLSLKLKRRVVEARYRAVLDGMYEEA